MTQIDHLKSEIETLSTDDFAQLRDWIAEKDWEKWDKQLAKDVASGKLDFLKKEALTAKAKNQLRDL